MIGPLHRTSGALALAAALALPASAAARPSQDATSPWATVNVCDTSGHPDGVGVRGWMPGRGGAGVRLEMRIRLQYRKGTAWPVVKGADSGWIRAGTGDRRSVEAGQTFTVTPPRSGRAYVLRGEIAFRWRDADGTVLSSAVRRTRGGHPGTAGADPDDFSAATCTVR